MADTPPDPLAAATLHTALAILEPLAALLLSRHLHHGDAEELLKAAFVQAAARRLAEHGEVPTVSALSVATGIRRREVKRLVEAPTPSAPKKTSLASQVRARWITDPAYLDDRGQPRRLPRTAPAGEPSFATLASAVSRDHHPRAVLDDLVRSEVAEEDGDLVVLRQRFEQAAPNTAAAMELAGANVGDHLWACQANLRGDTPPLTERAIFMDGLTQASARRAADLARDVWAQALPALREKLQALADVDADASDATWRMRIGIYGFLAPLHPPAPPPRKAGRPAARMARRTATKRTTSQGEPT